jgi:hypothetical protein
VRFTPGPGLTPFHLHAPGEFAAEIRESGLLVFTVSSSRELILGRLPGFLQDLDYLLYYVVRRHK